MAKYTWYIVRRSVDDHYPVLVASNGKVPFNEPVRRASTLRNGLRTFMNAVWAHKVDVVEISHDEFRRKFPAFAKNYGPRKRKKG